MIPLYLDCQITVTLQENSVQTNSNSPCNQEQVFSQPQTHFRSWSIPFTINMFQSIQKCLLLEQKLVWSWICPCLISWGFLLYCFLTLHCGRDCSATTISIPNISGSFSPSHVCTHTHARTHACTHARTHAHTHTQCHLFLWMYLCCLSSKFAKDVRPMALGITCTNVGQIMVIQNDVLNVEQRIARCYKYFLTQQLILKLSDKFFKKSSYHIFHTHKCFFFFFLV